MSRYWKERFKFGRVCGILRHSDTVARREHVTVCWEQIGPKGSDMCWEQVAAPDDCGTHETVNICKLNLMRKHVFSSFSPSSCVSTSDFNAGVLSQLCSRHKSRRMKELRQKYYFENVYNFSESKSEIKKSSRFSHN